MCFCEQRGENDPADAGKRVQDFHVTLRRYFRLMFRGCLGLRQRRHQTIHFVIRPGELLSDDGELREDHFDVGDSGLCRAGCNGDRRLAKPFKHGLGIDASNPMALQEAGDGLDANAPCLVGSWREAPEFADPGLGKIVFDLEKLRILAPMLLTGPIDEAGSDRP